MASKIKRLALTLLLGGCLLLSACGKETAEQPSEDASPAPLQWEDLFNSDGTMDQEKYNQYMGISVPEQPSEEEIPENVILLGARTKDYGKIYKLVTAFNQTQSGYTVKIQNYDSRDSMLLDLVRGKGCDLLLLAPYDLTTLSDKDGLEDLTPYFEKSEKVSRENLFDAVLEAGTAGGKLTGAMSDFTVHAILVEKGYTEDGGWTIEEYLALMDKYPEVPLSSNIASQEVLLWLMDDLSALSETFVNWDERTCSFESEAFIQTIETLKSYQERFPKKDLDYSMSLIDRLYKKQVQTVGIDLDYDQCFGEYRDIRDAFLGSYELAGLPTQDGKVCYSMPAFMGQSVLYSMNAASAKKDAAWLFLEYMMSEYQETLAEKCDGGYPVRRDIVERKLQEEVEAQADESYVVKNFYTNEYRTKRGNFTETDKEQVLYILDHVSPPTILQSGGNFRNILIEELEAFFAGDKTAAEAAKIIQNRVTTYLNE